MNPHYLSYANGDNTGTSTTGSGADPIELTKTIFQELGGFISVIGGPIMSGLETMHQAISTRRLIVQQELESFFKLDTNKNANLGYTIVIGAAILALLAYKIIMDTKKK